MGGEKLLVFLWAPSVALAMRSSATQRREEGCGARLSCLAALLLILMPVVLQYSRLLLRALPCHTLSPHRETHLASPWG